MTIKASDLSDVEKQNLLDALRKQIGDSQYNELLKDHDEDFLIEMVLQILNQKSPSGKETNWERVELGCFGVLWLILTFGVALFMNDKIAVLFFFSPSLCLLFYQPSSVFEELKIRVPKGYAVVVILIWIAILIILSQTMSEELFSEMLVVATLGGIAAAIIFWLVGVAVKLMRRWKGQR